MQSITVLGAGESGVGAALLAKKKGIDVFVSDYGVIKEKYKKELKINNIPFEEKGHTFERIESTELIVKSPGIPNSSEVIKYFRLRNKRIISEIEFAYKFYSGKIAAITGSNGKTTTSSLTYQILKEAKLNVGIGGNIGYSFARLVSEEKEYDWVILELSSFQLEDIFEFKADISALLNITPDHLDRYDYNIDKYAWAKWQLPLNTIHNGLVLLNQNDALSRKMFENSPVKANVNWLDANDPDLLVSKETGQKFEINLFGKHNFFNAQVALKIAEEIKIGADHIYKGLFDFKPIEHRLESVIEFKGRKFVNDSKATNLDSAEVALNAFEGKIIWIAGGVDKGNDYNLLKELVRHKVDAIVCLTKFDEKLRSAFGDVVDNIVTVCTTAEAVKLAFEFSQPGSIILLSPACASFDLFDNYEHRGKEFKKQVFKYIDEIN